MPGVAEGVGGTAPVEGAGVSVRISALANSARISPTGWRAVMRTGT